MPKLRRGVSLGGERRGMSCLFRRSNGIWYIVYRDRQRQRWLSTGTRCFGKAHSIFRTRPSSHDRRCPAKISDFVSEFEAYASSNYSQGTLDLYSHSFKSFVRCIGDKPMRFVTVKDVERYKTERIKTISPVSVNVELRTLKAAFNVALKWDVVSENVFAESRQLRVPIREPAYLTREEFDSVLCVVEDSDFRALIVLGVSTMMRRGEIVNLTWDDIDFERRLIHVRNKVSFTVKGHRPRVIPMSERAYQLLLKKKKANGFVFARGDGSQYQGEYVSHKFKAYVRRCSLPESIHFHSLRHTGATWLIQQDVPLFTVQKILGHTSPSVTQIYSHLSDQNLRQAIERINILPPVTMN